MFPKEQRAPAQQQPRAKERPRSLPGTTGRWTNSHSEAGTAGKNCPALRGERRERIQGWVKAGMDRDERRELSSSSSTAPGRKGKDLGSGRDNFCFYSRPALTQGN